AEGRRPGFRRIRDERRAAPDSRRRARSRSVTSLLAADGQHPDIPGLRLKREGLSFSPGYEKPSERGARMDVTEPVVRTGGGQVRGRAGDGAAVSRSPSRPWATCGSPRPARPVPGTESGM